MLTDFIGVAEAIGDTFTACLIVAVVVLWRRCVKLYDDQRDSVLVPREELLGIVGDYRGFTEKTRVALEQLTEIVRDRQGRGVE